MLAAIIGTWPFAPFADPIRGDCGAGKGLVQDDTDDVHGREPDHHDRAKGNFGQDGNVPFYGCVCCFGYPFGGASSVRIQ